MTGPTLYIFSGLPGSGKTTLARELAKKIKATHLRIDTIEQGLKDVCQMEQVEGEGYRLSYLIAKDNLQAGNDVIADSVNPWKLTRQEWNEVATSIECEYVNIEIVCSDLDEHRLRVEKRDIGIKNLTPPTWEQVMNRDYHPWEMTCIRIDTAGKSILESLRELMDALVV